MPFAPLLAGAPNFRDIGGYTSEDGRRVRHGVIYRSEGLADLTEQDLEVATSLGISLICDLRSDHERQQIPTRWPTSNALRNLHLDISADLRAGQRAMSHALLENPSAAGATQAMLTSYQQFPQAFTGKLNLLFEQLLSGASLPMVFHCAAGKDRTGFVAAMLLSALGVSEAQILEDYLLSAHYWRGERSTAALIRVLQTIFGGEPPSEVLPPLMNVDERYLAASFAEIRRHYQTVDAYLEHAAGLSEKHRNKLQAALLE